MVDMGLGIARYTGGRFPMARLGRRVSLKRAANRKGPLGGFGVQAKVIDLFCGAGGLTYGLELAGLKVVEGVDVDALCQHPYETNTNARFVLKSVIDYAGDDAEAAWSGAKHRVLVGCAPCQPFSTYTQGTRGKHRRKWVLLNRFAELVHETTPDIVSMENVTLLQQTEAFRQFVKHLEQLQYQVTHQIVDCRTYGAPQMRKRLVLLASRHGPISVLPASHEDPSDWRDVASAIAHLPRLSAGAVDDKDPLHRASRLSHINTQRIRASIPGGSWRDWPRHLVADCHRRSTGKSYPGVYGRMEWGKPAPTITGQCFGYGSGRFGHPDQDRALTLREAAILQTFPADYEFTCSDRPFPGMKVVGRMIGNAVPPLLGHVIGNSILGHLSEHAL